ncbi:putative transcription factor interactor and regulator CCHC(Zn) family [Helianthus annuus]|nr:putative transcription factor interactor and regulator CCHC(Zn) family [Helianthus annuus]KAJ0805150.1 putative transcription factor interactor and regulator CCHC(Zn) family [Helianthus annuus]
MHFLRFATRIVKEEIAAYCDFSNKQKQLKRFNKNCCKKLTKLPKLSFGCEPTRDKGYFKKKYKNKYKTKTKKRFLENQEKKFSPGKYFFKEKRKVCPQGKKKCRCWICSEEGHYANECPNRQIKFISEAEIEEYFPSENIFDGYTQVYTLEILDNLQSLDS